MSGGGARRMFVCLDVRDIARSMEFFVSLGFRFDPRFTDQSAACLIVNREACAVLLGESLWRNVPRFGGAVGFTCKSRQEVDDIRSRVEAAGGTICQPVMDLGSLYCARFCDLDGYLWEAVWTAVNWRN